MAVRGRPDSGRRAADTDATVAGTLKLHASVVLDALAQPAFAVDDRECLVHLNPPLRSLLPSAPPILPGHSWRAALADLLSTGKWRTEAWPLGSPPTLVLHCLIEAAHADAETLERELVAEQLVGTISAELICRGLESLDDVLDSVLGRIGGYFQADRVWLLQGLDDKCTLLGATHEWCAPEIAPQIEWMQEVAAQGITWAVELLKNGRVVQIHDLTEFPAEAAVERALLESQGVRSVWAAPLLIDEQLCGLLGIDWINAPCPIATGQGAVLERIAQIISGALAHASGDERLERMHSALWVLGSSNEAMAHAADENALLAAVCDRVVTAGGYRAAWIGYGEPSQPVRAVAAAGDAGEYLAQLAAAGGDEPLGQGPVMRAICDRRAQICGDISAETGFAPWSELALRYGFRSCIVVPIVIEARPIGALAIYAADIDAFDSAEAKLLSAMVDDLAFGIQALRERQERVRAEERFELAVRGSSDGIWDWDIARDSMYWSNRVYELLGYTPGEIPSTIPSFESRVHPDDLQRVRARLKAHLEQGEPYNLEYRMQRKRGDYRWFLVRGEAIAGRDGRPSRMAGSVTDIEEQKRAETHLRRLNRTYAVISACNKALVQARDESNLLSQFCNFLVQIGGYRKAWVGLLNGGPAPVLRATVCGGDCSDSPAVGQSLSLNDSEVTDGSLGAALVSQRPQIAGPTSAGGAIALPLLVEEAAVGALVIGSTEPDAFDDAEVILLEQLAADLAFGLHALRARTARETAEASLQLSNRAIDAARNGILILDGSRAEFPLTYANPAFEQITGYDAAEITGRSPGFLVAADGERTLMRLVESVARERRAVTAKFRAQRKDGTLFWNELYLSPVTAASGELSNIVGVINDVTDRHLIQAQLEYQAQHDELTGLPNRNLMRDRLEQAIFYAERNRHNVAVLLIDLDRFNVVNDSLGHPVGDELLLALAQRLQHFGRRGDTVARYGGDEFVVILADVAREHVVSDVARRILAGLGRPVTVGGHELQVTASVGISLFPRDGDCADVLLRNADAAMYQAKETGRNNIQFYRAELNVRMLERLTLDARLRKAIDRQEFRVHYQPQIRIRDGELLGLEALVRWQHPELGLMPPNRFIPLAEETGLIVAIGEQVLRIACQQNRSWLAGNRLRVPVAVNLSVRQLEDLDFPDRVAEILRDTKLEPWYLELEVTESALMNDPEKMLIQLNRLKALGCKLSLDDFGTGYSNLNYLRRFPFDRLKIDQSFVTHITTEPQDAAIARTIIAMAHTLGMEVLAEGVETEAQLNYLQRNGCDLVQGFLLGYPEAADDLEQQLAGGRNVAFPVRSDSSRPTLLVVDDEPNITRALTRLLRRDGYRILATHDPHEAFELLAMNDVRVILSDQRMPGMSGTDLLSQVKELYPDIVRLILSGYTELNTVTEAVNKGWIYRFLTKPWDDDDLRAHVREAFERYERNRSERQPVGER